MLPEIVEMLFRSCGDSEFKPGEITFEKGTADSQCAVEKSSMIVVSLKAFVLATL